MYKYTSLRMLNEIIYARKNAEGRVKRYIKKNKILIYLIQQHT